MENGEEQQLGVYAEAQREFNEKWKGLDLLALAKEMRSVEDSLEKLKERKTRAQGAYDLLRLKLIPDAMNAGNQRTVTFNGIGRISLTPDVQVSTKTGMKEGLFTWLKKNRLGDLIQPNVNSSTLRAFVKDRLKAGKTVPDEFLNVTPITRASITKV